MRCFKCPPPDAHGYCSLGCSVDVSVSAMHHARHVIAMVNKVGCVDVCGCVYMCVSVCDFFFLMCMYLFIC